MTHLIEINEGGGTRPVVNRPAQGNVPARQAIKVALIRGARGIAALRLKRASRFRGN